MSNVLRRILLLRSNKNCIKIYCSNRYYGCAIYDDNYILSSGLSDVIVPEITVQEHVFSKLQKYSKYTALECAVTGRSYTFDEVIKKSRNFSKALRKKLKLQKGDTVAVMVQNVPEFPIAVLGVLEAGLVCTTINYLYTLEEITKQMLDSSAKAVITLHEFYDTFQKVQTRLKSTFPIISIKNQKDQVTPSGAISFDEFANTVIDIPDITPGDPKDLAFMPYSSGTTGLPKGVLLTHLNLVSNMYQGDHPDVKMTEDTTDSHQDIVPCVIPMFHIYGFTVNTMIMITNGAKVLAVPKFLPDLYTSVLKNNNVSIIYAAPPLVLFLNMHNDIKPEYLKNLRFINSGAAPLSATDEEHFITKFGTHIIVVQGYGLTETSPILSVTTKKLKLNKNIKTSGSSGRPAPNTFVKIIEVDDSTGKALGPNKIGELLVKGPQVMKGYHNRPEESKNSFLDGWLRTGDLSYYNEDGCLFIKDRLKELIKVKGFQVPPAELEGVIREFPQVAEAAVIGIPHPTYGEVPRAYIIPKGELNVEKLENFVNEKVAPYKRLKGGIQIVESIPKNASGKILRRQLKLLYESENK